MCVREDSVEQRMHMQEKGKWYLAVAAEDKMIRERERERVSASVSVKGAACVLVILLFHSLLTFPFPQFPYFDPSFVENNCRVMCSMHMNNTHL